eukprot:jgi/Botrbrau1/18328/Bobra.0179s0055.1
MESGEEGRMRDLLSIQFSQNDVLGAQLAWSRAMNLLACSLQPTAHTPIHRIAIVCPEDPEVYSVLEMPEGTDELLSLIWTPPRLPNALLALTQSGAGFVWMQVPGDPQSGEHAATIDCWYGDEAFRAEGKPVVARWLLSPLPYAWPIVGVADRAENFERPFAKGGDTSFHWASPGAVCAGVVSSTGLLQGVHAADRRQVGGSRQSPAGSWWGAGPWGT